MIKIYRGDCLELMKNIKDNSIDMILCDPPYGTTSAVWDKALDCNLLWEQYNRIIKQNGAIVLFSQLPFSCDLITTNRKYFRYEWVWQKNMAVGFFNAKKMPLRQHENILVFYKRLPTYNPQMKQGCKPYKKRDIGRIYSTSQVYGRSQKDRIMKFQQRENKGVRYPTDVLQFKSARHKHATQKPIDLLMYLIKTYTNENETVLDNCMGSGSTGVACKMLNRKFIGMELRQDFFNVAVDRILSCKSQGELFL